jgi:hypothetical protein
VAPTEIHPSRDGTGGAQPFGDEAIAIHLVTSVANTGAVTVVISTGDVPIDDLFCSFEDLLVRLGARLTSRWFAAIALRGHLRFVLRGVFGGVSRGTKRLKPGVNCWGWGKTLALPEGADCQSFQDPLSAPVDWRILQRRLLGSSSLKG